MSARKYSEVFYKCSVSVGGCLVGLGVDGGGGHGIRLQCSDCYCKPRIEVYGL